MGGCPSANAAGPVPTVSPFHAKPQLPKAMGKEESLKKGAGIDKNQLAPGAYREFSSNLDWKLLLEHYQPPEFPPVPVIGRETNALTNESWKLISGREYDDPDSPTGKVKGSVYFYNTFFRLLFDKSTDFKSKFPTVQAQASVMSKVMSLCLSIEFDKLDLQTSQLQDLGRKHQYIVQDPWQYAIYATTLHSALKICLGDDATPQLMTAWLHVFSFVLRTMLPSAITPNHVRVYAGAVNATTILNEDDQLLIKNASEYKSMKSDLASLGGGLKGRRDRLREEASRIAAKEAAAKETAKERELAEHSTTVKGHALSQAAALHSPDAVVAAELDDVTDAKEFNEKAQERERQGSTGGTGGTPNAAGQGVTVRISGPGGMGPGAIGSGRTGTGDNSPKLKANNARVNSITGLNSERQPGAALTGPGSGTNRANMYRAAHTPGTTPGSGPVPAVVAAVPGAPGAQ